MFIKIVPLTPFSTRDSSPRKKATIKSDDKKATIKKRR